MPGLDPVIELRLKCLEDNQKLTENITKNNDRMYGLLEAHFKVEEQNMKAFREDVLSLRTDFKDGIEKMKLVFVQKVEFEPVQKLVYGAVRLSLSTVLLATLALVIIKAT